MQPPCRKDAPSFHAGTLQGQKNTITAQAKSQPDRHLHPRSHRRAPRDLSAEGVLGRPWKPYHQSHAVVA
ncbi:hypothetical protein HPP92_003737 [Vanilla planifolia]|uniref:Uncharacterized protein n=1 Tax=Vanilla planifolia TaxID=51239 RepID=A0A835VNK3_VANPL|nr:hypothetical protein HPP92_003737 [Vanilla planifolia]